MGPHKRNSARSRRRVPNLRPSGNQRQLSPRRSVLIRTRVVSYAALTGIWRKFASPISASSKQPLWVKRKHGFFAIRTGRTGQAELLHHRSALKEAAEERPRFTRDADNLVRCLTIEFKIELGLGSTVVPIGKKFELSPSQAPLRKGDAFDGDAHTRRLPGDLAFLCDRFG